MVRPFGVTIISIILYVHGFLSLALALAAIGHWGPFQIFFEGLFGLVLLYLGYSMWNLELWAWMSTLFIEIFNVFFAIITAATVPGAGIYWVTVVVGLVIIVYLNQPQIRAAFSPMGMTH
jgi:hypothetical protein